MPIRDVEGGFVD